MVGVKHLSHYAVEPYEIAIEKRIGAMQQQCVKPADKLRRVFGVNRVLKTSPRVLSARREGRTVLEPGLSADESRVKLVTLRTTGSSAPLENEEGRMF